MSIWSVTGEWQEKTVATGDRQLRAPCWGGAPESARNRHETAPESGRNWHNGVRTGCGVELLGGLPFDRGMSLRKLSRFDEVAVVLR